MSAQSSRCPACCHEAGTGANACPWVEDMLGIFGGILFLRMSRSELAPFAPCRRQHRQALVAVSGVVSSPPPSRPDYLRLL